jgi:hypothetical protein
MYGRVKKCREGSRCEAGGEGMEKEVCIRQGEKA